MYCITDQQIEYILNDIGARGVKMESLQQNLLDHVCCIIEQNLEENGDFADFYNTVIRTFYKKELGEIEEETKLLLTFKNYYEMRKTMFITGAVSAAAFIAGSFLKVMHWPGASLLLVTGFLTISFIFLPLMFVLKARETNDMRDKLMLASGTAVGILYCISMLFLVNHWPGMRIIWLTTLTLTAFVFIPAYFFTGIRKQETKVNTMVSTVLIIAVIGIQFAMTRLRPQPSEKLDTWIQSEQLLQQMQYTAKTTPAKNSNTDKLAADIQNTCRNIKTMIWNQATGQAAFPEDLSDPSIAISENDLGNSFSANGTGYKLFRTLKEQVAQYNASGAVNAQFKIPVAHSLLSSNPDQLRFNTNLFALNDITQIQLALANAEREETISMK